MLWHQKESAERKVAHRDWPAVSSISRNPRFSWAIPELDRIQSVQDDTPQRPLLLDTRCLTIHVLSLKCRNLPARSVLRHSSDNERCGHPAASVGVSSFSHDA